MPPFIQGSTDTALPQSVLSKDLGYDYPEGLKLRPGSKLHSKLRTEILKRATEAAGTMSKRHASWRAVDDSLTTYVRTNKKSNNDQKLSAKSRKHNMLARQDSNDIEIVFPYSYTILETLMSYLMSAFVQDPMFRYEGVGSEDIIGATLLEKVIALDCIRNKVGLAIHTLCRDGLSYGIGVATPTWREKYGKKRSKVPRKILGIEIPGSYKTKVTSELLYEGNDLENIDPYLILPDTNFGIQDLQKSEFFGWVKATNLMDMLNEEKEDDNLFNVKYLKDITTKGSSIFKDVSGRSGSSGVKATRDTSLSNPVDEINMYIKLVPKDWELGDGEYPEKWYFTLSNDTIITRAMPLGLDHDDFPVVAIAPDFDGYSVAPISKMEILGGMQSTLDWMFNSHIKNVRKAINDMFVIDPYLINAKDVENPEAGKVIRTRRPAWGRGVKDSIMQFPVADATRGHVADAGFIMNYMEKVGGADSAAQGSLRQGGPERLTGAEFKGTQQGQFNRLNRLAQIIGMQAMQDIGYMFAMHTQQFLQQDTYVKIVGNLPQELEKIRGAINQGRMQVSPYDLLINFDVIVKDGSLPGNDSSGVWIQLYEILSKTPELAAKFDMVRIFEHIAKNNGAKDIEQFEARSMPNEQVQEEVGKGNLIPSDQAMQEGMI